MRFPERRLLVAAAAPASVFDERRLGEKAMVIADWTSVIGHARRQGVLSLMARRLPGGPWDAALREDRLRVAQQGLDLARRLPALLGLFREAHVPALAFKGPSLAAFLYGDPAARVSTDLDVLVHRRDAVAARCILERAGMRGGIHLPPDLEARFVRGSNEFGFTDHDGNIVEIAWALAPRPFAVDLDADVFFERAVDVDVAGAEVATLAADDMLVALCVHGGKHLWERLGWVADVAQLLEHPGLDLDRAIRFAEQHGVKRMVLVGVALAHGLLGAPLDPPAVRALADDPASQPLARELASRLYAAHAVQRPEARFDTFRMRLRERPVDRLRVLGRSLFEPTLGDWTSIRLPPRLGFVYPLIRPGRLAMSTLRTRGRRGHHEALP